MDVGVVVEARKCVIIIIISWLWLSGRLAAVHAHLVNETWRCSKKGRKRWGRGKGGKVEETTQRARKWWKTMKVQERYMEAVRAALMSCCLMKRWANEVLVVYIITSGSSSHSFLRLPFPLLPATALTVHLGAVLRNQQSRSEIPFLPRRF